MTPRALIWPLFLLMEVIWLYAGIALLVSGSEHPHTPSPLTVVFALLAGYAGARIAQRLEFSERTATAIGLGGSLVIVAIVLRLQYAGDLQVWNVGVLVDLLTDPAGTYRDDSGTVLGGLALCGVWLRGTWLGGPNTEVELAVPLSFGRGTLVFGIGIAIGALTGTAVPARAALPFAVVGLTAVALSRPGVFDSLGKARLPRWWMGVLGGGLAAALAIAAMIAVLPWSDILAPFAPVGEASVWALTWAMIIILTPVFYAVIFILSGLLELLQAAGVTLPEAREIDLSEVEQESRDRNDELFPGWLGPALRYGVMGIVAFFLIGLALRPFRRRFGLADVPPDRVGIGGQPRSGGGRRWSDFFRRGRRDVGSEAIAKLYAEALAESERRGLPRPANRTPLEFAPDLSGRLDAPVAAPISDWFARARYGRHDPDDDEVARLRRELQEQLTPPV